jgi:hypothetical protein
MGKKAKVKKRGQAPKVKSHGDLIRPTIRNLPLGV